MTEDKLVTCHVGFNERVTHNPVKWVLVISGYLLVPNVNDSEYGRAFLFALSVPETGGLPIFST